MPAQEPAVDDKDDDVDLPPEDSDASRGCFLPSSPWAPACSPSETLSAHQGSKPLPRGAADTTVRAAPGPQAEMGVAGGLP